MSDHSLFPIQDATGYSCSIQKYAKGHSSLWIKLMNKETGEPPFYLNFSNVRYLSAPISWKNGNFYVASSQDCETLLVNTGLPALLAAKYAAKYLKLYEIKLQSITIQIIASAVMKKMNIPSWV